MTLATDQGVCKLVQIWWKAFLFLRSEDVPEVVVPRVEMKGLLLMVITSISVSEQLCVGRMLPFSLAGLATNQNHVPSRSTLTLC
jgi:hypothetical protein